MLNAEDNSPLIGATILVEGEAKGTVADTFGRFELIIEKAQTTLIISILGFYDQTINVHEHDGQITILLESSATEISHLGHHYL